MEISQELPAGVLEVVDPASPGTEAAADLACPIHDESCRHGGLAPGGLAIGVGAGVELEDPDEPIMEIVIEMEADWLAPG